MSVFRVYEVTRAMLCFVSTVGDTAAFLTILLILSPGILI